MKKSPEQSFSSRKGFLSMKNWLFVFVTAAVMLAVSACRTDCADGTAISRKFELRNVKK